MPHLFGKWSLPAGQCITLMHSAGMILDAHEGPSKVHLPQWLGPVGNTALWGSGHSWRPTATSLLGEGIQPQELLFQFCCCTRNLLNCDGCAALPLSSFPFTVPLSVNERGPGQPRCQGKPFTTPQMASFTCGHRVTRRSHRSRCGTDGECRQDSCGEELCYKTVTKKTSCKNEHITSSLGKRSRASSKG